jgi:anti-anti-sigma regulatory factor
MIEVSAIDRLRLGDHACVVFNDDTTRLRSLATYIRAGLRERHRILYFGGGAEEIEAELAAQGTDAGRAIADGHLRMSTPEDSYLASGSFHPQAAVDGWRYESDRARDAGYTGLRAVGDMSWASRPLPGADRLTWYEAQVNRVFADGFAMAICLYDRRLFTDATLREIRESHPATVAAGSDPQTVPLLRAVRTVDPPGIRLEGEADLSNRGALRTLMDHLREDSPDRSRPLVVDLSGLRFLDGAAARTLSTAAAAGLPPMTVVGASPSMRTLLAFAGEARTVAAP